MELADYSDNAYLKAETAVSMVLFGGRLILAHNRILYPNRKWFMQTFENAPDKPEGIIELANQLLDRPCIETAKAFCDKILNYREWPKPPEGKFLRFIRDHEWQWRKGHAHITDW